jgi:hypothetical protein
MSLSRHSVIHHTHDAHDTDPGLRAAARERGADRAFLLLRTVFTIAPIAFGLDKFAEVLTDNWEGYLAGWVDDLVPGTAHEAMLAVGVVEIVAGLVVALAPRFGGLLVAAWLGGIIVNLLTLGDFYDVALRDFGLLVAAVALSLLAAGRSAGANSGANAGANAGASS